MSKREVISGVIESKDRSGKGVKLDDGEWYRAFAPSQLRDADVGAYISFEMEPRDSGGTTYLNIKGNVWFPDDGETEGPPEERGGGARGGRGGGRGAPQSAPRGGRGGGSAPPARQAPARSQAAPDAGAARQAASADARAAERTSIERQVALKSAVEFFKEAADVDAEHIIAAAKGFAEFLHNG